jgi:creatinine amidohydrolase/Fe(II)-dependent formamide hydrolase-like protein
MKKNLIVVLLLAAASLIGSTHGRAQAPSRGATGQAAGGGQRGAAGRIANVNNTERTDVATMPSPIALHDTVWMEDLTMLEIRDLLKQGKTTALILTGGVEENGPYLTTGKHNNVLRVMGPAIAKKLGNALIAPIVTMEPGNPVPQDGRVLSAGSTLISPETFVAILTDMANSLKSQGFKTIVMLGDNGGNARGMAAAVKAFNDRWKSEGGVRAYTIPEYYSYTEDAAPGFSVQAYEETLGIHEKIGLENGGDGFHDDFYISAFVMLRDLNDARIPERIKARKSTINTVELAPGGKTDKTLEIARKLVEHRTDVTVKALQKAMAANNSAAR